MESGAVSGAARRGRLFGPGDDAFVPVNLGAMTSRLDWTGIGLFLLISLGAVALTAWQVQVDRSVFERFLGALDAIGVMIGVAVVGVVAIAYLQGISDFAVLGPGGWRQAVAVLCVGVPLLAAAAIGADLVFRFPEDTNVAMPDALRFYPAIAVLVEVGAATRYRSQYSSRFSACRPGSMRPSGGSRSRSLSSRPSCRRDSRRRSVRRSSVPCTSWCSGRLRSWVFWRFGFDLDAGLPARLLRPLARGLGRRPTPAPVLNAIESAEAGTVS